MKNLRLVRNEIGFTQKELAQLLGVSQQSYSDYENEITGEMYEVIIQGIEGIKAAF